MPGGAVFQGLAKLGFNVNWILTGYGSMLIADNGQSANTPAGATDIDPDVLTDVLAVLRQHQDRNHFRWKPDHEAKIVAEIYQYLIETEQEQPTAEDRAKVFRLITSIIGGTNEHAHTQEDN